MAGETPELHGPVPRPRRWFVQLLLLATSFGERPMMVGPRQFRALSLVTAPFVDCNRFELSSMLTRVVDSRTIGLGLPRKSFENTSTGPTAEGAEHDAGQTRSTSGVKCRGNTGARCPTARRHSQAGQGSPSPSSSARAAALVFRMGSLDARGQEGLGRLTGGSRALARHPRLLVFRAAATRPPCV